MRAGENLRGVGVQTSVVDVQGEVDHAGEDDILMVLLDSRVSEEEAHGEERANNHGVLAAQHAPVAHKGSGDGSEDTACVGQGIVAPCFVVRSLELRSASG